MEVQGRESDLIKKTTQRDIAPAGREVETRGREEFREGNYDWKHETDKMASQMGA